MKKQTFELIKRLTEANNKQSHDMLKTLQEASRPIISDEKETDVYTLIKEYFEAKKYFDEYFNNEASWMEPGDWGQFETDWGLYTARCAIQKTKRKIVITGFEIVMADEAMDLVD